MTPKTKTALGKHTPGLNRQAADRFPAESGFFEEVEHTADMALHCGGHDLASLFRNAARGMYHLMGMVAKPDRDPIRETVCMTAPDVESLLVDWLSELAYRAETANQMFGHMDFKTLSATCLDVAMTGCRVPCCDHQIKAVTYHRLKITKTGAGLETVIVFDV